PSPINKLVLFVYELNDKNYLFFVIQVIIISSIYSKNFSEITKKNKKRTPLTPPSLNRLWVVSLLRFEGFSSDCLHRM
ncbi:hypothetical protein, partial [Neobacillus niacini]|uniref:hypothetical protein n=1 Tax=Neobacillus niacini TaxID=86668 RepID=UPI002FFE5828